MKLLACSQDSVTSVLSTVHKSDKFILRMRWKGRQASQLKRSYPNLNPSVQPRCSLCLGGEHLF